MINLNNTERTEIFLDSYKRAISKADRRICDKKMIIIEQDMILENFYGNHILEHTLFQGKI